MGFLANKRILITGMISTRSIAYGVAQAMHREGAQLAFTYQGDPAVSQYQVSFRYFRRLEGTFKVAAEARVLRVEARLIQDGVVKASQSVAL